MDLVLPTTHFLLPIFFDFGDAFGLPGVNDDFLCPKENLSLNPATVNSEINQWKQIKVWENRSACLHKHAC